MLWLLFFAFMPLEDDYFHMDMLQQEQFYRYYFNPERAYPDVDVLHYDMHFEFNDVSATTGKGDISITIALVNPTLRSVSLDFINECTVTSVSVDSVAARYNHTSTKLIIDLPQEHGDTIIIRVLYNIPSVLSAGIISRNASANLPEYSKILFSFTEPIDSRYYFPCVDNPDDKALLKLTVVAPEAYKVAGNGTLVENTVRNGKRTSVWVSRDPICTYLISFSVSDYAVITDTSYEGVPLRHYVYSADSLNGVNHYAVTGDMVDIFSSLFGNYPFEAYGHMQAPIGGGMEHQTMTTYFDAYVTQNYEWGGFDLISHELAHQWWGDWVTLGTWKDIWLNEGFATYSEALMREAMFGREDMVSHQLSGIESYKREDLYVRYPIYDPPWERLFGSAVYEKGGYVLHMLRYVVGDEAFFEGLQTYGAKYKYSNAVTTDFIAEMELASGMELDWFFDQWVYQAGYPEFDFRYIIRDTVVRIQIEQTQVNAPLFTMPMDILVRDYQNHNQTFRVNLDQKVMDLWFTVNFKAREVILDPDEWILKTVYESPLKINEEADLPILALTKNTLGITKPAEIQVFDPRGRIVLTKSFQQPEFLELHDVLSQGIYFIKANDGHTSEMLKVVIVE